jgi:superfamily I DNA/RNA helicase
LEGGVVPERVAFVTFTRAACHVALTRAADRLAVGAQRFPWVRTVHSAAFGLLGLRPGQILGVESLAEFAKRHAYKLTPDTYRIGEEIEAPLVVLGRQRDDVLLYAYEWGRNGRLDIERTLARCPVDALSAPQFRLFVARLQAFKAERGLLDFADLLDRVLEAGLRPGIEVAMVDEAHDLSPLQVAVVEMWFAKCQRVYVCADDDQSIYGFQGASSSWVRELAARSDVEVLHQSYRVPVVVHALAQRIISSNLDRLPKAYEPTESLGRVISADLDQALALVDGSCSTFVLCRNRIFIGRVARILVERGIPFLVEGWGGRSPMSAEAAFAAVRVALRLARGEDGPFPARHLRWLLALVASDALVPSDAKDHVKARRDEGSFRRAELVDELGLQDLLDVLATEGPLGPLAKLPQEDRRYFERVIERYRDLPLPQVVVTSIHGAKGREADLVLVLPDMTRRTYQEYVSRGQHGYEVENRVFYVAVTRARKTVVLVQPRTRRHFAFPRAAFVEGNL